ncbi:cytochrome c-type biogenesis protein [Pseudohongiella spirulinae]|uniref:Cytochrome c-type biogenesis protein n=1 Tax=Pseudohongiella spirulinae TaxID=1249552 RepID=A0A0S2KDW6_9GAMM|nr:cytochrome c-type biogenesis protein [Pseudohongiella spirulinae]ALO46307.1 Cytochrome C biogenesis protein [Pseudohongiella spirulinae]
MSLRSLTLNALLAFGLVLLLPAGIVPTAHAQMDVYEFETDEQQRRFRQLSNDFRCPMCQNANLSSSPGGVAADLRREIYLMIIDGMSDEEIESFMLERYGDFILYRPRLTVQTLLLWFGPVLFLLAGVWIAWNITRRSGRGSEEPAAISPAPSSAPDAASKTSGVHTAPLSPEEKRRLAQLLGDDIDNPSKPS